MLKAFEICGDCCGFSYETPSGKRTIDIPCQKSLTINDIVKIVQFLMSYLETIVAKDEDEAWGLLPQAVEDTDASLDNEGIWSIDELTGESFDDVENE